MPRTDVHRPEWVRVRDPLLRREFTTLHDHRDGVCDLDREPPRERFEPWTPGKCYSYYSGWRQYCGCRLCTGYHSRRTERRRDRHSARRRLRSGHYDTF